ncbi:capsular polysaccharide biosynthesis, putative [Babesia ovata]|uniref:Capsular polysaccharide biosynthesis, putative n=1 Tax=Babesia ovata TaxID=189622 RepID=A0A2H6KI67_9APIC|nr:capsular polysaccharide biosynthesis, putative [Babesia ovata]GBE62684.1 capsular polysaccharide biosynthesis, putative [Babesia ovata]
MVESVPKEPVYRQPNVAELLANLTEQQTHLMETYKGFLDSMRLETNLQEAEGKLSGLKKAGAELIALQKEHITKLLIMLYPIFRVVMPPSQFEEDACIQMLGNRTQLESYDLVELSCVLRCYFAKLAIYVHHMATFVKDWGAYEHAVSTDPNLHHGADFRTRDSPESTKPSRTPFNAKQPYSGNTHNTEETRVCRHGMSDAGVWATSPRDLSNLPIVTNVKRGESINCHETSEFSCERLLSDLHYNDEITHHLPVEYPEAQNHAPLYDVTDSRRVYYNRKPYGLMDFHDGGDMEYVEDHLHRLNHTEAALYTDSDRLEDCLEKRLAHELGIPDIVGEYLYSQRESSDVETGTLPDVTARKLPLRVSHCIHDGVTRDGGCIGDSRLSIDMSKQESEAIQPVTMRSALGPPDQVSQHDELEWENKHLQANAMKNGAPRFGNEDYRTPGSPSKNPLLISQHGKSPLPPSGDVYTGTPLHMRQEGSNSRDMDGIVSFDNVVSRDCDVLCCGVGCQGKEIKHGQTDVPILASEAYHPSFYAQRAPLGQHVHVKGSSWNNKDVTYLFYQTPMPVFDRESVTESNGSFQPAPTNNSLSSMGDKTQQTNIKSTVADSAQYKKGGYLASNVFGKLDSGKNGRRINKSVTASSQVANIDDASKQSDGVWDSNTEQCLGYDVPRYMPFVQNNEQVSYVTRFGLFDRNESDIVIHDSKAHIRRVHAPSNDMFMDGVEHSHRSYSDDRGVKSSLASNFGHATQSTKQLGLRHLQLNVRLSQQDKLASETFETSDLEGSSCRDSFDILQNQYGATPSSARDSCVISHDVEAKSERCGVGEDQQATCARFAVTKPREIQCVAIPFPRQSERKVKHDLPIADVEDPACDAKDETANQPMHAPKMIEHSVQPLLSPTRDMHEDNLSSTRIHIPPLDMSKLRAMIGH